MAHGQGWRVVRWACLALALMACSKPVEALKAEAAIAPKVDGKLYIVDGSKVKPGCWVIPGWAQVKIDADGVSWNVGEGVVTVPSPGMVHVVGSDAEVGNQRMAASIFAAENCIMVAGMPPLP